MKGRILLDLDLREAKQVRSLLARESLVQQSKLGSGDEGQELSRRKKIKLLSMLIRRVDYLISADKEKKA